MRILRLASISILLFFNTILNAQADDCICCTTNHKAFDFWIGVWNVTDSSGTFVGTNRIEKLQDDCVLQENWIGSSGSTGTSTNFFNSQTMQWEQLWVDNQGTYLKLRGNRHANQMILSSDVFMHTDGNEYINQITWTLNEDGSVRQLWELLQDGSTIRVLFDGLYTRTE